MYVTRRLALLNSLVLVMDRTTGEPPRSMGAAAIAATPSCVAIGTLPDADGETSVTLADGSDSDSEPRDLREVFDGIIATPSRKVHLCTTSLESVGSLSVPTTQVRVRVWTNHRTAPDQVLVVVSGAGT